VQVFSINKIGMVIFVNIDFLIRIVAVFLVVLYGCNSKKDLKGNVKEPGVGWAPTPSEIAKQGLKWISVGPGDVVYELGCGDGRVAIEAAKMGAEVFCIELNDELFEAASARVKEAQMDELIEVLHKDLFSIDISRATVVYIFLLPSMNEILRPIFESNLQPGTRIISREFEIPGWKPGERLELPGFLFLKWVIS
jgi:SAM-dependent methyltransferase